MSCIHASLSTRVRSHRFSCELPFWLTFVSENASSCSIATFSGTSGSIWFSMQVCWAHHRPVHGQDETAILCTPPSCLQSHAGSLFFCFYFFFGGSFLRHLARSSLFPSHAGGGVPLGFVMVALFTTTLRHCAMRSKHLAAHTTLHLPGQAAVMASLVAVLHFSVLLASSTVSRASHSSSALSATSAHQLLGQSVLSTFLGCSASLVMAVSIIYRTRLPMVAALMLQPQPPVDFLQQT